MQKFFTLTAALDSGGTLVASMPPLPFDYKIVVARAKLATSAVASSRSLGVRCVYAGLTTIFELGEFFNPGANSTTVMTAGENMPANIVSQFGWNFRTVGTPLGFIFNDKTIFSFYCALPDTGDVMSEISVVIEPLNNDE